jgi:hypothetical protein
MFVLVNCQFEDWGQLLWIPRLIPSLRFINETQKPHALNYVLAYLRISSVAYSLHTCDLECFEGL